MARRGSTGRDGTTTPARRAGARAVVVCLAVLAAVLVPPAAPTVAAVPAGFTETTVVSGLGTVTAMAVAPDGRLFVATQGGSVRVVRDGVLLPTPFLTLTTDARGERGLTGIALDPDFARNGLVYLNYTVSGTPAFNRVSRFVADGDVARSVGGVALESPLTDLDPWAADSFIHNAGALGFGPDGKLYVAVGDNGTGANAQSLASRHGKLLRLNPDGSIPTDNPFAGTASGANRAIWALGLRNPFTFAFSRAGLLHVNDVGQDAWEEVNQGRAGANYGWPTTEGPTTDPRFTSPVYAYGHTGTGVSGCAITGGAFYDPVTPRFPSDHVGDYSFADYCSNWIKRRDASGTVTDVVTAASPAPIDLEVGPDGALYYLSRGARSVVRVAYTGQLAPSVSQQPLSQTVSVGEPVTFAVSASGTAPLSYQWQRDGLDVAGATGPTYRIGVTALSDSGARFRAVVRNSAGSTVSTEAVLTVTANRRPTASITAPATGATYVGGDVVAFSGGATDPESGGLPPSALTWQVDFHHADHVHPFMAATSGTAGGSFTVPTAGHVDSDVWYRVRLRAQDAEGLVGDAVRDVMPRTAGLTVTTSPPGLRVDVDGQPRVAPYQERAVVGLRRTLSAPSTQQVSGVEYQFAGWSDGGAASHTITTGAADATYTAAYRAVTRTLRLPAAADTMARQADPTSGAGPAGSLVSDGQVTSGTASRATAYLRFAVPALAAGESVAGASLSLQVTNGTANGPAVWRTATAWTESGLTWNTQPARSGTAAVGNMASVAAGRVAVPVSGVTAGGEVSFQLHADSTDGMAFASREATTIGDRPELVLVVRTAG